MFSFNSKEDKPDIIITYDLKSQKTEVVN